MLLVKPGFEILTDVDPIAILKRIEVAGRTCYKSDDKITEDSGRKFVAMLVKRGHESVLEHELVTVKFIVDRGVSHELVRHRLCAFSQESTRYCDYKGGVAFVIPPWCNISAGDWGTNHARTLAQVFQTPAEVEWHQAMYQSEERYTHLRDLGWSPQQARSVLPNSLKTEVVTTANLRQWRHILRIRTTNACHPQMTEVMRPLLLRFQELLPEIFGDISREW